MAKQKPETLADHTKSLKKKRLKGLGHNYCPNAQICPVCDGWVPPDCVIHICPHETNRCMENVFYMLGTKYYERIDISDGADGSAHRWQSHQCKVLLRKLENCWQVIYEEE